MSWHEQRAAEPTLHTDVHAVCPACIRCSHVRTGRARNERAACRQCSPLLVKGRRNHCGTVTCTLGSRSACASQSRHRGCRHRGSPFQNLPVRGRTCASHRSASRPAQASRRLRLSQNGSFLYGQSGPFLYSGISAWSFRSGVISRLRGRPIVVGFIIIFISGPFTISGFACFTRFLLRLLHTVLSSHER